MAAGSFVEGNGASQKGHQFFVFVLITFAFCLSSGYLLGEL